MFQLLVPPCRALLMFLMERLMSTRWVFCSGFTTTHSGSPLISAAATELTVVTTVAESEVWRESAMSVRYEIAPAYV